MSKQKIRASLLWYNHKADCGGGQELDIILSHTNPRHFMVIIDLGALPNEGKATISVAIEEENGTTKAPANSPEAHNGD